MGDFGGVRVVITTLVSLVSVYLVVAAVKILHKQWWNPRRVQKLMALQGIKGPSYKLVYGNTKEIFAMQNESMSRPKSLSHDIFSQVQPHFHLWIKAYGKNFLHWYGSRPQLVVTEPELCKEILNNKDRAYPKTEPEGFVRKLLGDGLVTIEGEKWGLLRKVANHAFHGESLKSMTPATIAAAEMMLERWKHHEGKEIEVFEEFRLFTSELISRTAFGSSYLEGEKIFEMLTKLAILSFNNFFKPRIPIISKVYKTSDEIESDRLEKEVRDSIIDMVKKRENNAMSGEEDRFGSDFLGLLVKAHHEADYSQRITVDDLVDECKTFYFAGQETANSMLSWTVFLLALHTDWQDEARKEVLETFEKQNPSTEGITKLKIMNMIINESLRLYPPVVSLERKAGREVRLGNLTIPANVEFIIPCLALHHEPEFWGEDVHLFKPERFSEGVAKATKNNIATFLPFGMGLRNCVGVNFATNEIKIVLSMILQRYTFTLSPGYQHSPFRALTVRPQHGVQVMLHSL